MHRGFAEQCGRCLLVGLDAITVIERDGIFHLRVGVVGACRLSPQLHRLAGVLGNPTTVLVERAERILRIGAAALCGDAQQLGGPVQILREHLPLDIEQSQIIGGNRMAELGGGGKPLRGGLPIARASAALDGEDVLGVSRSLPVAFVSFFRS